MQRLTGLDSGFLSMETDTCFMHVAGLIVVDPSTSPDPWSFDKVRRLYEARLDQAPPFRRRLVEVPWGIHHPVWIEDPDFDLDWHLRQVKAPSPGGAAELRDLVAEIVAEPLDRSRPLWESWVIEGLEDGNVGLLTKVHHAAIDGTSGEELMIAVLDLTPEMEEKLSAGAPWQPDHVPNNAELLGYAAWSLAQQPTRAARTLIRTAEAALQLGDRYGNSRNATPSMPFTAPRTSFNQALTAGRNFGAQTVSLERVKALKGRLGCTVNDVVLTLCAGALRRHLDSRDEQPDGPLLAMVPVSVRTDDERNKMGNRVSSAFTSLATDLDDPLERLRTIQDSMHRAKEAQEVIGANTLQDWAEFAAPALAARAARMYSSMRMADRHRPLFNVTISNVPGPPFPLYVAGARVVATNPIGPIFDGGGLNITVMSYMDRLDFGLLACPDLIPDVQAVADAIPESLEELEEAAGAEPHATPS